MEEMMMARLRSFIGMNDEIFIFHENQYMKAKVTEVMGNTLEVRIEGKGIYKKIKREEIIAVCF
ncbi:putative ATP binding protein [Lysinibacillus phage phiG2]|nr:putative ATP binding protein [Lysinibacillus phage phiG2]